MNAGEGEGGGLHAAPIVPESALGAPADAPDAHAPADAPGAVGRHAEGVDPPLGSSPGSPESSVTQPLPMVRRDGGGEPSSVRAVARRVPSALPALGRDEIADAPRSARTTADRRRRAAAEARTHDSAVSGAATAGPASPGAGTPARPTEPDHATAAAEPVVEPAPQPVRSVELVIEPLPVTEAAPVIEAVPGQKERRPDLERVAPVARSRSHGMPVSRGGQVTATQLMGQPAPVHGDVLEAEILDDPPPSQNSVSAAAAEVLSTLTEVAFREARTDEWIMSQPEPIREPGSSLEPIRPGPRLIDSDTWDTGRLPAVNLNSYQGRRRAVTAGGRLWLVISLVVSALIAAIAIPFVLTSSEPAPVGARTPDARVPTVVDSGAISGTSAPGSNTGTSAPALPVIGASPLITTSPTPPVLLTIQAEQGAPATAWGGTAGPPTTFAGTTVIDELGEHWSGGSTNGWLEFRNIDAPSAGPYVVKIYYVYTSQEPNNAERRMNVTANGTAVLRDQPFSPVSSVTVLDVTVTLRAGSNNTIRLTHGDSECPAIDKIEIIKP